VQKRIFLIEFLPLRLVIVHQGSVRIPESKNIRLWQVRMFIYEKLCSFLHFRTINKSPKTFEQIKTLKTQSKIALVAIFVQSGVWTSKNSNKPKSMM
jgi:hypothetical protein